MCEWCVWGDEGPVLDDGHEVESDLGGGVAGGREGGREGGRDRWCHLKRVRLLDTTLKEKGGREGGREGERKGRTARCGPGRQDGRWRASLRLPLFICVCIKVCVCVCVCVCM